MLCSKIAKYKMHKLFPKTLCDKLDVLRVWRVFFLFSLCSIIFDCKALLVYIANPPSAHLSFCNCGRPPPPT